MWVVHVPKRVEKELLELPSGIGQIAHQILEKLGQDPYPSGCKKLKGRLHCWRIRIGSYRILYDVDERRKIAVVLKIGPRRNVYRYL